MATLRASNLEYALGWMVIHSLWEATVIALVVSLCMFALRNKSAKMRYLIACGGLLGTLVVSVATFFHYFDLDGNTASAQKAENGLVIGMNEYHVELDTVFSMRMDFSEYFDQHLALIVAIWMMGVAIFTLRLLGATLYVYYLKRRYHHPIGGDWQGKLDWLREKLVIRQAVELLESARVQTPVAIGMLKPIILFPIGAVNQLSARQVESILAHELAHIRRHDYAVNILQSIVEVVFYFHPAVWWLSGIIRTERENCCDDIAVALNGDSMGYAKALVSLQEMRGGNPMMAMGFMGQASKSQLMNRVKRILNQPQNQSNIMEKLMATSLLVLVMALLSYGESRAKDTGYTPVKKDLSDNCGGDTLPDPLKADGSYSGYFAYLDNLEQLSAEYKNGQIIRLNVNGNETRSSDFGHYKESLDKKRMEAVNQPADGKLDNGMPTDTRAYHSSFSDSDSHTDSQRIELQRKSTRFSLENLVQSLKAFDTNDPKDIVFYGECLQKTDQIRNMLNSPIRDQSDFNKIKAGLFQIQEDINQFERDNVFEKIKYGWQKAFEQELVKDGMVKDTRHYFMNLMSEGGISSLTVDGKVYTGDVFVKYRDLFEHLTGVKLNRVRMIHLRDGS